MIKCILLFVVLVAAAPPKWHELSESYSFETYARDFGKQYQLKEIASRRALFSQNLAKILAHNRAGRSTYKKGVNRFTDRTDAELKEYRGLHRPTFFTEKREVRKMEKMLSMSQLPLNKDWREENIISTVKDQGRCGSCWTFGSSETVESYWALATGELPVLSQQFILDCTSNPQQCGGTGGCGGATATLAIETIKNHGGIPSEFTYPYRSYFAEAFKCNATSERGVPFAKVKDQIHLPINQQMPVLQSLATTGPLITNVMASDWSSYESGIYDGCPANATIDHVVQLVGYGHDAVLNQDYFLVRNSWNPSWGENGYIRLKRDAVPTCGWDNNPLDGNTCVGGPTRVQVCGQCGILYSNSYVEVSP